MGSSLVLGALDARESRVEEQKGAAASFLVRFGGRRGNFQLKATIYCSKSRVINCTVRETAGYPPPLGVAENQSVPQLKDSCNAERVCVCQFRLEWDRGFRWPL